MKRRELTIPNNLRDAGISTHRQVGGDYVLSFHLADGRVCRVCGAPYRDVVDGVWRWVLWLIAQGAGGRRAPR